MSHISLLKFPCDYPIKVVGINNETFEIEVLQTVRTYFPNLAEGCLQIKKSKESKYISMTIQLYVESQSQLDALYGELHNLQSVLFTL